MSGRDLDHRPDRPADEAGSLAPGEKDPVDVVSARTSDPYVIAEDSSDQRGPAPKAARWHGAVRDPDHPEFHDRDDRQPLPQDALADDTRRLVVDDASERRALAALDPADPSTRQRSGRDRRPAEPGV